MKRVLALFSIITIILLLGLMVFPSRTASAGFLPQNNPLASGDWTEGNPVEVDLVTNPAPAWLQLVAGGTKTIEAGEICHPFRGGQFYWVGEIRQLKDGKWIKLATTVDWSPNKEGKLMACANAPAAGIYALFAWFDAPEGYVEPSSYIEPA